MTHICKIPFKGTAAEVVAKIRTSVEKASGRLVGDEVQGTFQVKVLGGDVAGKYLIICQDLNVSIEKKPFYLAYFSIENYLKDNIS